MKRQSTAAKILLAILLFFQSETCQARTVQSCSDCTLEACRDADDKEWCITNCKPGQIPNCLKAIPEVKDIEDANRYGNIKRLELLREIYEEFPLSKYFLDVQAPEEEEREKNGDLTNEEKEQLKGALQKLEKVCQGIVEAAVQKGEKLPGGFKTLQQITDILKKVQTQFAIINENLRKHGPRQEIALDKIEASNLTFTSTRFEVKIVFDKSNLGVKNCFNQGETAIFTLKQQQEKCIKCTVDTCKDVDSQDWCVNNCNLNKISKCLSVPLKVKNKDIHRYSGIKRVALFNKIYKDFPLSKYFLDFKSPEDLGAEQDLSLSEIEKKQLKGAINELEKACKNIITQLESSKGKKLSARDQQNTLEQMKESMLSLEGEFEAFNRNLSESTRLEVMRAFDNINSNLKAFLIKGEEEVFKANQKEGLISKTISRFNCRVRCTANKCKNPQSYHDCRGKCPAYQIKDCLRAGTQAVAALNR